MWFVSFRTADMPPAFFVSSSIFLLCEYVMNLICELHDGGGDLGPVGLSLRPDIRLPHCRCGHNIAGFPAQWRHSRGTTGFSVPLLSVNWRRHGHRPLGFFGNYGLEKKKRLWKHATLFTLVEWVNKASGRSWKHFTCKNNDIHWSI